MVRRYKKIDLESTDVRNQQKDFFQVWLFLMFVPRGSSGQFQSWSGQKFFVLVAPQCRDSNFSAQRKKITQRNFSKFFYSSWLRRSVATRIFDSDQNSQPFFSQIVGVHCSPLQSHFGMNFLFWPTSSRLLVKIEQKIWEKSCDLANAVVGVPWESWTQKDWYDPTLRTDTTQPMFSMFPIFWKGARPQWKWNQMSLIFPICPQPYLIVVTFLH